MVARAAGTTANPETAAPPPVKLDDVERLHILAVLRKAKGNQAEAARLLGIGRNTLWRKLRRYGGKDGGPARTTADDGSDA